MLPACCYAPATRSGACRIDPLSTTIRHSPADASGQSAPRGDSRISAGSSYGRQPVPLAARKSALALGVVMLGLTFFSASMWTSGTLGTSPSYDDFFLAVLLGSLVPGLCTAVLGFISARTSLSTHLLAHCSFDGKGSWLPSALLGGTQVSWFGVSVMMFAIPVAKATGLDVNLLILVSGALITLTMFLGITSLTLLLAIAVPAIVVLGSYSVWLAVRDTGGLAALQQVTPSAPLDLSAAIVLMVGSFISADTLTADFVRFGRSTRIIVVVRLVAFFLGNSLMFIFGATGITAVGESDISDVMITQGLLIPAILVLGLNIWITNDNALYASGLGFANITSLSSRSLTMLNGVLGTLAAPWLYNRFVGWLTFLSTTIPPIGGVTTVDYLSRRRRYHQHPYADIRAISWAAILAVACGTVAGHWLPGTVPVNTVLGAAITYLLLSPLLSRNLDKPEEVLRVD